VGQKKEFEPVAENRRAHHKFEILETFEAGVELKGAEVKSIRKKDVSLEGSFGRIDGDEIFLHNMHVAPYAFNTLTVLDPTRTRKLLLKRKEINRLLGRLTGKKLTIVPLEIYLRRGWVKVKIGLAAAKAGPDRRQEIKKRESDREVARELRERNR
jgi:SsrA-binding protein